MASPTAGQKRVKEAKEALRQAAEPRTASPAGDMSEGLYASLILAFMAGLTTGSSKFKQNRLGRLLLNVALDWVERKQP